MSDEHQRRNPCICFPAEQILSGQAQLAHISLLESAFFSSCLPKGVGISELFAVLDLHFVPLGHDPVDFHEGFILGLRDNEEDVNHGGHADGTEDEEAVGPQPSLEQ